MRSSAEWSPAWGTGAGAEPCHPSPATRACTAPRPRCWSLKAATDSLQILKSSFWNTGHAILHLYRLGSAFNPCRDLLLKSGRAKARDF